MDDLFATDESDLVGKTIESVDSTEVPGVWGKNVATVLYFTDGTSHTFVHPEE